MKLLGRCVLSLSSHNIYYFLFLSTTTMNTTYDEPSEFSSPKTNMAPTTTFAKSKKGVVILVALCMMFFYTGRLSSSSGGGAPLDASLLRGFQQDVVGAAADPCASATCPFRCNNIVANCAVSSSPKARKVYNVLTKVRNTCGCTTTIDCANKIAAASGQGNNPNVVRLIQCVERFWN